MEIDLKSHYLQVSKILKKSSVNGPGERFVIWVQGCSIGCRGCFSPETHDPDSGKRIRLYDLAQQILACEGIEGITFSGGEPMEQARPLALLSGYLKQTGLTVVCYSGYTLNHLIHQKNEWIHRFLKSIDLLIAGPYVSGKAANLLWRGSSNQKIHFLTPTYQHLESTVEQAAAEVEFTIDKTGFTSSGVWPDGFLDKLNDKLRG